MSLTAGFRFCGWRGRRQGQRGLSKRITPAGRRANVGVAEPEAPLEGHAFIDTLEPEPRRHDSRVSPDPDNLRALVLVLALVDDLAGTCGFEKVLARVCLAVAEHQHEIVGEDPAHGLRIVTLDRRLVLGVERRDAGAIVFRGSQCDGSDGQKRGRCQHTTEIELHVSSSPRPARRNPINYGGRVHRTRARASASCIVDPRATDPSVDLQRRCSIPGP